jgi:hypothetical protein
MKNQMMMLAFKRTALLGLMGFALGLGAWTVNAELPAGAASAKAPQPASPAPEASAAGKQTPEFCSKAIEGPKRNSSELVECVRQEKNPDRMVCLEQALCSSSPALRGEAIAARIAGMANMVFEVTVPAGDDTAAEELSKLGSFGAKDMKWDEKTGRSFSGHGIANDFAQGEISGDQLTVSMGNTLNYIAENKQQSRKDVQCTVSVKLDKDLTKMEGTARCSGVKSIFKARFGFG